jgi:2-keto-4-pentenoate hydratase
MLMLTHANLFAYRVLRIFEVSEFDFGTMHAQIMIISSQSIEIERFAHPYSDSKKYSWDRVR